MYPLGGGGNGGPTETWRSDITRQSAIFIDQPLAACFIAGVNGGSGTFAPSGSNVAYSAGAAKTYPVNKGTT